jgi:hypothetical protein
LFAFLPSFFHAFRSSIVASAQAGKMHMVVRRGIRRHLVKKKSQAAKAVEWNKRQ